MSVRRPALPQITAVLWTSFALVAAGCGSAGGTLEVAAPPRGQAAVGDPLANEIAAGFVEVARESGSVEFRAGQITATAPTAEDRTSAAVTAAEAFQAAVGPSTEFGFAALTEAKPVVELVRVTNKYRGEVDPDTLEFTPTFVDQLVWMVVYEDVLWEGVGSGPAPLPGMETEGQDLKEEIGLSDAVILVDAMTGDPVHAFTDHASYVAP
jgi:hypothetical protein